MSKPDGSKMTTDWLKEGEYEIEAMGERYGAQIHMKTPFDAKNLRIQGDYSEEQSPGGNSTVQEFMAKYHKAIETKTSDIFK